MQSSRHRLAVILPTKSLRRPNHKLRKRGHNFLLICIGFLSHTDAEMPVQQDRQALFKAKYCHLVNEILHKHVP